MINSTINKVYHKARELHEEKRIDSELWYAILEMKDAHIKEIDLEKRSEYFKGMKECCICDFNDENYGCICPHSDKWYACPIENKKPENIQALEAYADCANWLPQYEGEWVTENEVEK